MKGQRYAVTYENRERTTVSSAGHTKRRALGGGVGLHHRFRTSVVIDATSGDRSVYTETLEGMDVWFQGNRGPEAIPPQTPVVRWSAVVGPEGGFQEGPTLDSASSELYGPALRRAWWRLFFHEVPMPNKTVCEGEGWVRDRQRSVRVAAGELIERQRWEITLSKIVKRGRATTAQLTVKGVSATSPVYMRGMEIRFGGDIFGEATVEVRDGFAGRWDLRIINSVSATTTEGGSFDTEWETEEVVSIKRLAASPDAG